MPPDFKRRTLKYTEKYGWVQRTYQTIAHPLRKKNPKFTIFLQDFHFFCAEYKNSNGKQKEIQ